MATPEIKGGKLQSDYLLATRLPNVLGESDVVVLAGLHGPGTAGVENLLFEIAPESLEPIAKAAGPSGYYQAIFRVSGFRVEDGTTIPTEIELVQYGSGAPRGVHVAAQTV